MHLFADQNQSTSIATDLQLVRALPPRSGEAVPRITIVTTIVASTAINLGACSEAEVPTHHYGLAV